MVPIAAGLLVALHLHRTPIREAVSTATAGCVTLVPEGLVLLASVAFAVGAARMARRGALVQRLSAVESLAGVDVVCVDKTGTLTDGTLALDEIVPLGGHSEAEVRAELGAFATSLAGRNPTADAIADALGGVVLRVQVEVPFSSRWKWSGLTLRSGETQVLGAPDVLLGQLADAGSIAALVDPRAREQRRVLLFARASTPLAEPGDGEPVVPRLEAIGLVALTERMRDHTSETIAFMHGAGIAVKVISGDGPVTVEAVARAAGLQTTGRVITGPELPREPRELGMAAERCVVFARIQPEQKRALVEALVRNGRRVAMVGDGVNDVPALKASQVAIALGSGSQIAKGVADLVLVGLNFAAIPAAVEEGRKILRNVRRVAKLFVAKSVFAAVLILTVGIAGGAYPFLPRQLSLAAAFTVGLPTFFLALAPPPPERAGRGFLREILAFAVPAGMVLGFAVLLGHGLVHGALDRSPSGRARCAPARGRAAPRRRAPCPRVRRTRGPRAGSRGRSLGRRGREREEEGRQADREGGGQRQLSRQERIGAAGHADRQDQHRREHRLRDEQLGHAPDVAQDLATLLDGGRDRGEVEPDQHEVGDALGDLAARAERDRHLRRLQRGHVVDAVADHRDAPAVPDQRLDEPALLIGLDPREDDAALGSHAEFARLLAAARAR